MMSSPLGSNSVGVCKQHGGGEGRAPHELGAGRLKKVFREMNAIRFVAVGAPDDGDIVDA